MAMSLDDFSQYEHEWREARRLAAKGTFNKRESNRLNREADNPIAAVSQSIRIVLKFASSFEVNGERRTKLAFIIGRLVGTMNLQQWSPVYGIEGGDWMAHHRKARVAMSKIAREALCPMETQQRESLRLETLSKRLKILGRWLQWQEQHSFPAQERASAFRAAIHALTKTTLEIEDPLSITEPPRNPAATRLSLQKTVEQCVAASDGVTDLTDNERLKFAKQAAQAFRVIWPEVKS